MSLSSLRKYQYIYIYIDLSVYLYVFVNKFYHHLCFEILCCMESIINNISTFILTMILVCAFYFNIIYNFNF